MYRLLLVSDQKDVLEAFEQVENWEFNGFRKPHIRHDLEGAKDSLLKHHADGIGVAMKNAEDRGAIFHFLREHYPQIPIFEPGRTVKQALEYLAELRQTLNWLRADYSSDTFDEQNVMIKARRYFFRHLVGGTKSYTCDQLFRELHLLRSRMNPNKPCVLIRAEISDWEDQSPGTSYDTDHLLERELYQSIGGDVKGFHVLPLVTNDGQIFVLAGSLWEEEQTGKLNEVLDAAIQEGIRHAEEYQGLHLRLKEYRVLPSIYALCSDYREKA